MPTAPPPDDQLDAWHRAAIAETMRPCREVRRDIRAGLAAVAAVRNEELDARNGADRHLRTVS